VTRSEPPARAVAASRFIPYIVLIVIAGAGGFVAYRATIANRETPLTVAPASPAPAFVRDEPPPAPRQIPEVVPEITLPDGAGVRHNVASEWKGHPLVINFWATWCEPCRREIPLLKSLRHQHSAQGLQVVGIAVDVRKAVLEYAHDMHIDYPVLIGEQEGLDAVSKFGMETVFPFSVFADAQGRIVTLKIGELHPAEAALILDRVEDVDNGRMPLAQARQQIAAGIRDLAVRRARAGDAAGSPPE